jgi:hemin uptake protein HemP
MKPASDDLNKQPPTDAEKEPPKTVTARELFGDAREIRIDHDGTLYVLRITRRGKLILQK